MVLSSSLTKSGDVAEVVPHAPIVLVGRDPWWETAFLHDDPSFIDVLGKSGWTWLSAQDENQVRWLVSIRRVSLVIVAGDQTFLRTLTESIRSLTSVPLVVIADDARQVVDLLRMGVDAVLPSAEPGIVMVSRLNAVLRRSDHRRGHGVRFLRSGDLVIDLWTRQCSLRGQSLSLSATEFDLLAFFMTRPEVTISGDVIVRRVWEFPPADYRNALRIVINRLRRKLGDDACEPSFIAVVRGSGYRFMARVTEVADSLSQGPEAVDVAPLLESLTGFIDRLSNTTDMVDAAHEFVSFLDHAGMADGVALFLSKGGRMHLLASRNMPDTWLSHVRAGVPLDPRFASAHSVLCGEVVQFADVRAVSGQYSATARELSIHGFRACHFVPILQAGEAWGHLGIARRSLCPLDDTTMIYLRSLCAVFLLHTARLSAELASM